MLSIFGIDEKKPSRGPVKYGPDHFTVEMVEYEWNFKYQTLDGKRTRPATGR